MQPTAQAVGGGREEGASPGGGERKICRVFFRPFRGSYILGASIPRLTAWAAFFRRSAAAFVASASLKHFQCASGAMTRTQQPISILRRPRVRTR